MYILLYQSRNSIERFVLIRINQSHESVAMWRTVDLKFSGKPHRLSESSITALKFGAAALYILAAAHGSICRAICLVCIAIWAIETHARAECTRSHDAHG